MRYDVSATLKASYSKENIKCILEQGAKKGYRYYAFGSDTEFTSIDLAVEGIMTPNEFDATSIMAKINETVLDIVVVNEADLIGILIGNFESEIGLQECVQFFLSMIKDFAILEINTLID